MNVIGFFFFYFVLVFALSFLCCRSKQASHVVGFILIHSSNLITQKYLSRNCIFTHCPSSNGKRNWKITWGVTVGLSIRYLSFFFSFNFHWHSSNYGNDHKEKIENDVCCCLRSFSNLYTLWKKTLVFQGNLVEQASEKSLLP